MKTLVKGCIVEIDSAPFAAWYEKHYGISIGKPKVAKETKKDTKKDTKKGKGKAKVPEKEVKVEEETAVEKKKVSHSVEHKHKLRLKKHKLNQTLQDQFQQGRLLARVSSRPGQVGRCDGYILEGPELDFYLKKVSKKKSGK
jgi:small subunit ribosomal protein S8e